MLDNSADREHKLYKRLHFSTEKKLRKIFSLKSKSLTWLQRTELVQFIHQIRAYTLYNHHLNNILT